MQPDSQQFEIKVAPLLRPIFFIMSATRSRSRVTVRHDSVHAQLGYYKLTIPGEKIVNVERAPWNWVAGFGVRTDFSKMVALVGAPDSVVLLRLREPVDAKVFRIPVKATEVYLSLDDADAFINAIGQRFLSPT